MNPRASLQRTAMELGVLGLIVLSGLSMPAIAQNRGGENSAASGDKLTELGQVTVTAQKREESIQDVSVSVTAIDGNVLNQMGAFQFLDYAPTVPGMSFSFSGIEARGVSNRVSLRGVAATGGASTTGWYYDETPLPTAIDPRLVDIERVEVLRGPQGTLYGSGSMGGTVKVIPRRPELDIASAWIETTASDVKEGDYNFSIDGVFNVPLSQKRLALRVSAYADYQSGIYDRIVQIPPVTSNTVNENIDDRDLYGVQASLLWTPTEALEVMPSIFWQTIHEDGAPRADISPDNFEQVRIYNLNEPMDDRYYLAGLTVKFDIGFAELVSSTSYFERDLFEAEDITEFVDLVFRGLYANPAAAAVPSELTNDRFQHQFTQELRLASSGDQRLTWLFGAYYQESTAGRTVPFRLPGVSSNPDYFDFGTDDFFVANGESTREQFAVFADVTYKLIGAFSLSAGVRHFDETFDSQDTIDGVFNGGFTENVGHHSEDGFNPRFGVDYEFSDDAMVYANVAKGFRGGGSNLIVPTDLCQEDLDALGLEDAPAGFDSDDLWSYEAGVKTTFLDKRLSANVAAYFIDWSEIQQTVRLPSCGFGFVGNLGTAENKGFELELHGSSLGLDGLSWGMTVGYIDAEITDPGLFTAATEGDRVQNVPEWTASAYAQFTWPLSSSLDAMFRGDFQYMDESYTTFDQTDVERIRPAFELFNFRIGISRESWEAWFFVDNAFDEHVNFSDVLSIGAELPGRPRYVTNRPRTIGLTFNKGFNL